MYSEDIEKVCDVCVHATPAKGSATHMHCEVNGGYMPRSGACANFKYDVMKKRLHRRREFEHKFTAKDFEL